MYNLTKQINEPTRITLRTSTLLDNIFINFENGFPGEVVTSALSDHEAQILKINNTKQAEAVTNETRTKKRIFSDSKLTQLRNELQILTWATLYSYNDPNEAYDYFFGTLKQLMDVVVPLKKFKISGRKKRDWKPKILT
ncbi:hypothetical protein JTB14_003507 [Gonioctena quinquepunctata]|nr:hypothetical protein JTB14_003507 [Gonioctena quinquepunctata]